MKKLKSGRKKVKDGAKSCTVSLRGSEKKQLIKQHGTLTKAIKTLLNESL